MTKRAATYALVVATRPDVIKMTPIVRAMKKHKMSYVVVHGDQHFDDLMDAVFFSDLGIDKPKYRLVTSHGSDGRQLRETYDGFAKSLADINPDVVVVYGDTMSAFAAAVTGKNIVDADVVHVEAGLRSRDARMREETYRMMIDIVSDVLFCPTELQRANLEEEGVFGDKLVVGNTVLDVVEATRRTAEEKSEILAKVGLTPKEYVVVTLHRAENVDDVIWLSQMLHVLGKVAQEFEIPVVWPLHPRVRKRLAEFRLTLPLGVKAIEPLGYFDFLKLEANAKLILTDSGGIQEEACVLGVPCATARRTTERPETLAVGSNVLIDVMTMGSTELLHTLAAHAKKTPSWVQPWGTPDVGDRVATALLDRYGQ